MILPQKQSWFNTDRQCPGHCYTLRPRWTVFVGLSPQEAGEGGGGESDGLGSLLTFFFLINLFIFACTMSSLLPTGFSLVAASGGYSLVVVCVLLIAVASPVAEHRL